jgi:hypothetical protein
MKLGEIIQPLQKLLEDAHAAELYLEENDTQFARRAYVRSVFANVEGSIWLLKQTCLKIVKEKKLNLLTLAEWSLLSDKTFDLTDKGEPREQQKFLKLPDNIRFTFHIFNRLFKSSFSLGVDGKSWAAFRTALELRNRLAHPKEAKDIDVSDEEIKAAKDACGWFNGLMADCIQVMSPK